MWFVHSIHSHIRSIVGSFIRSVFCRSIVSSI